MAHLNLFWPHPKCNLESAAIRMVLTCAKSVCWKRATRPWLCDEAGGATDVVSDPTSEAHALANDVMEPSSPN